MITDTQRRINSAKRQIAQSIAMAITLGEKERKNLEDVLNEITLDAGMKVGVATSGGNFAINKQRPPTLKDFKIILYFARQLAMVGMVRVPYIFICVKEMVTEFAIRSIASPTERLTNILKLYNKRRAKKKKEGKNPLLEDDINYEDYGDEETNI